MLKERALAFRNDPRVVNAMAESNIPGLAEPTIAPGETWRDLANEFLDVETAGKRGYHYEALDQLALEHLMGAK
jgi:xylose isomerase